MAQRFPQIIRLDSSSSRCMAHYGADILDQPGRLRSVCAFLGLAGFTERGDVPTFRSLAALSAPLVQAALGPSVNTLQGFKNCVLVAPDGELVMENVPDYARLVDQIGHSLGRRKAKATTMNVVELDDRPVRVGDQGKRQSVGRLEPPVALRRVRADTYNDGVLFPDGFIVVTEATSLHCSAAREIFRIEIQDYVLLAEPVRQPEDRLVVQ